MDAYNREYTKVCPLVNPLSVWVGRAANREDSAITVIAEGGAARTFHTPNPIKINRPGEPGARRKVLPPANCWDSIQNQEEKWFLDDDLPAKDDKLRTDKAKSSSRKKRGEKSGDALREKARKAKGGKVRPTVKGVTAWLEDAEGIERDDGRPNSFVAVFCRAFLGYVKDGKDPDALLYGLLCAGGAVVEGQEVQFAQALKEWKISKEVQRLSIVVEADDESDGEDVPF